MVTIRQHSPDPSIKALFNRLKKVNTQLNLIEEGWPHRPPSTRSSTLKIDHSGCQLPQYALTVLKEHGKRMMKAHPTGWEFTFRGFSWGGHDSGAMFEIFINGQSFASVRYFSGDKPELKTKAHCVQACADEFMYLTTNAIARLAKYPHRRIFSKRYKDLCALRRKLNQEWHAIPKTHAANVPGPFAYPYGEHKPGWPCFEGMQLGK